MYGKHKIYKAATRKNYFIKYLSLRCIKLAQNFSFVAPKVEAVGVAQI
jgi:hypothetical protein